MYHWCSTLTWIPVLHVATVHRIGPGTSPLLTIIAIATRKKQSPELFVTNVANTLPVPWSYQTLGSKVHGGYLYTSVVGAAIMVK